jgi:hypothetical protein
MDMFEKYGSGDCRIILIKEYMVCDKLHLRALEQLWINKLKPINKNCAFQIPKLYVRQYTKRCKEKRAKYYQENREKFLARVREKYEEQDKHDKIQCDACSCTLVRCGFAMHVKTQKHIRNVACQ